MTLAARAPAKVNLVLRVLGRRDDGYHELDTVFQTIDLWDRLEMRPHDELCLRCDDPAIPTDGRNLVLRAAELVRPRARGRPGAAFRLTKGIPAQGGLGGGSSDAAAALRLCASFWKVALAEDELTSMAAELGADVPFFLVGGTARGRGRGDRIEPLPFVGAHPFILGIPPFGIATSEVFQALDSRLTLPANGVSLRPIAAHKWWQNNDFSLMVNDLEPVVFHRWPVLERFRDALLEHGARRALMSGSGSAVFGIFGASDGLDRTVGRLSSRFAGWRVLATRAVRAAAHVAEPRVG